MKDKVLVKLVVPIIDESYDIFLPVSRKIGSVIKLLNKAIGELSNGLYVGGTSNFLYSSETGERYNLDAIVKSTDIRNGARIVLF